MAFRKAFSLRQRLPSVGKLSSGARLRGCATGGSAVSGEEPLAAARRELREELGYAASEEEMRFVARLRRSNSYCYVYAVKTNRMENDFSLQKEEVSAVRWCSPQRLMQMVAEGSMYNYGDAYYKLLLEFQRNNMRA